MFSSTTLNLSTQPLKKYNTKFQYTTTSNYCQHNTKFQYTTTSKYNTKFR